MEPVITVNLAGNAYQLDASAHQALKAYLDQAEAALASNPDKAEIMRDLEQAIADKINARLSAFKTVASKADIDTVLQEMGPVEGAPHEEPKQGEAPHAEEEGFAPRKRLYRVRDGAMFSGVCAGLGAYFALDANLIRFLFVIAAFVTHGAAIIVYVVMMFLVPSAHTSAEWAAAHGLPSTAQEVIDQAKRNFQEFTGPRGWRPRYWRREMRRQWHEETRARARAFAQTAPPASGPFGFVTRIFGGLFLFVFSIVGMALLLAFLFSLYSLATAGAVLGWSPPGNVPIWMAIVLLCIMYGAIAGPLGAMRSAAHSALTGRSPYWDHSHGGVFPLLMLAAVIWVAYHAFPDFHAWADFVWTQIKIAIDAIVTAFSQVRF